ncbi:UNVERIFIED_CONTAM: hypothetical protein Sindi_0983600, partial [Sesamum indicum]
MVMKRPEHHLGLPPPMYSTHVPEGKYIGGSVSKFDYVLPKECCMETLNIVCDSVGIIRGRRFCILLNKGFKLLIDNNDFQRQYKRFKKAIELSIYVDVDMGVGEGTEGAEVGDGEGGDGAELGEGYQFLGKGVKCAEGGEVGEGVEVDDGEGGEEADVGEGERDEDLVDSDFEMEKATGTSWGECSESSESENEETDVIDNDGDLDEHKDSDREGTVPSYHVFNLEETYDPTFELGMMFSNKAEFKKALQSYAIKTKRTLKFIKNDKVRVYANCGNPDCEWTMHASKVKGEETFQINLLRDHHSCPKIFEVKNVKTNWIKDKYLQKFKSDLKRCVKGFRVDIINELRMNVSRHQAYRTKKVALKELEGSPQWQYSKLWDYLDEIRKTNPMSTMIVGIEQIDGEERFSRFYVCFGALKTRFKAGCRPIIRVDGCHLKGPNGGILLTTIGVDPNNCLYPIAYAVVNKECRETWEWFLIVLKNDLNITREYEYTFMSDKQKGLMQAFEEVFPRCDHRFCVRHLHNNFKQAGFRGLAFKNALWNAVKACTVGEWKMRMQEMKILSQQAFDWFNDKPVVQWT